MWTQLVCCYWKIAIIVHEWCRTVKWQIQQNTTFHWHNNSGHNIQYVYIYIYCFNEKHEIKVNLYKSSFTGNNLNYTAVLD